MSQYPRTPVISSVFPDKTIGDYWRRSKGKPLGFDNLRVILAFSVILWHTVLVCYGRSSESWFWTGPLRPLAFFIVPSFFALSGFLVASSLLRNDLLSFAALRAIRIYPALAAEVLLSAFLIGFVLTKFSMHDYFSDSRFFKYMLNVVGWIHYELPGLFLENPGGRAVNLQLWTVPFELECYVLLILLAFVGLHRKPVAFLCAAVALTAAEMLRKIFTGNPPVIDWPPPGAMIVLCFIFGVAFFLLKDRIKINFWTFVVAFAVYATLIYNGYGIYASPIFVAYATIYIGIQDNRLPIVGSLANYSYGIYLYGFPMQQVFSYLLPDYRIWWVNFILSASSTVGVAALSWHLVEKPVNNKKSYLVRRIVTSRDRAIEHLLRVPACKHAHDTLGFRAASDRIEPRAAQSTGHKLL